MIRSIEDTYFDSVSVYRNAKVKQTNGSFKFERTQVYQDLKCALSIGTRPSLNSITDGSFKQDEIVNLVQTQDRLFLSPEFIIQQGDEVIISHQGRNITATAGLPYLYDSHQVLHVEEMRYA